MLIYLTPYSVELKTFYSLSTLYRNSARSVFRYKTQDGRERNPNCGSPMSLHYANAYPIRLWHFLNE